MEKDELAGKGEFIIINTDKKFLSKERLTTAALVMHVFPYAWLLMKMHIEIGFLWAYLPVASIALVLVTAARVYGSIYLVLIGNVISIFISYWFIRNESPTSVWEGFFEPFQPVQAMFLYTGMLLVPQAIALIVIEIVRRRNSRGENAVHTGT